MGLMGLLMNTSNAQAPADQGETLSFESRNPRSYEQLIGGADVPRVTLTGRLLMPTRSNAPVPAVILTPGSGGVGPHHIKHAHALIQAGIAVFVIDPFTGRGIKDTVTDQTSLSFAGSTYDILAAAHKLATLPVIDKQRIGAVGYSRGGTGVLLAAASQVHAAAAAGTPVLKAVYGGWPWCGYQFERAATTRTAIRLFMGEADNYVSSVQCQGMIAGMRQSNAAVSWRMMKDGNHGFGYDMPLSERPEAIKALHAPVVFLNDRGVVIDWLTSQPQAGVDDLALLQRMRPWVSRGVTIGPKGNQVGEFTQDMVSFFTRELTP
jgi:dienelactone hydrolase